MSFSLGLRQIFSYLLPGAVSIFLLGTAWDVCFPETLGLETESGLVWWPSFADTTGEVSLLGGLAFALVSIAVGIMTSSWFKLGLGLAIKKFGDPRLDSLRRIPAELKNIVGSEISPVAGISLFYYFWSVVKLKVEGQLEFALFGIYALNFCVRVLGVTIISIGLCLAGLFVSIVNCEINYGSALLCLPLVMAGAMLFRSTDYFFSSFCYFGISMFTAAYQLELSQEERAQVQAHVQSVMRSPNAAEGGRTISILEECADPYG